jgi:protein SCO1/2
VVPVFITVDPQRDTPKVVQQYAGAFGPEFVGLTGTPAQIAQVAKEYRVYYAVHRTGQGPDDYTVDHSSVIYLMGPDGNFIAPISAGDSPAQMAQAIAKHLS